MLEGITYFTISGIPFIVYLGIITLFFLLLTATVPVLNRRGINRIPFNWHPALAKITIIIAIIHATLGILAYF